MTQSKTDKITTAQQFFKAVMKILGENQLYRTIYGDLPTDDDSAERIRKSMKLYDEAQPLLKDLDAYFESKMKS